MPGLGLGLAGVADAVAPPSPSSFGGGTDYMWEITGGSGNLQPVASGSGNDTWVMDSSNFMPASSPSAEGYWDLDGNSDIQPLDV